MHETRTILEDVIMSPPAQTSSEHNEFLSGGGQLVLMAQVLGLPANNNPTVISNFSCTVEHSADGRRWKQKNLTSEIPPQTAFNAGVVAVFSGGEPNPTLPSLGFVRVSTDFTAGEGCRITLIATRRRTPRALAWAPDAETGGATKVRKLLSAATERELSDLRASPPLSDATRGEVRRAMAMSRGAAGDALSEAVLMRLSGPAMDEIRALSRRLARLSPRAQSDLMFAGIGAAMASFVEGPCGCKDK